MKTTTFTTLLAMVLMLLLSNDAHADPPDDLLTGVWTGRRSCSSHSSLEKYRERVHEQFVMSNGFISFGDDPFDRGASFRASLVHDAQKPYTGKAELALESCHNTNGWARVGRLKVRTTPRGGGRMSGTTLYASSRIGILSQPVNAVSTCRWSFKRTSTVARGTLGCSQTVKLHVVARAAVDEVSALLLDVSYPDSVRFLDDECIDPNTDAPIEAHETGDGHLLIKMVADGAQRRVPMELRCNFGRIAPAKLLDDSFKVAIPKATDANHTPLPHGALNVVVDVLPLRLRK